MSFFDLVFWLHLAMTLYLTGLVWFVQVVHYPLMGKVGEAFFQAYEQAHTRLTTYVVAPPMLLELGTGVVLYYLSGASLLHLLNLILLTAVWLSTFLIQVPLHNRLSEGFDAAAHRRLVRTNWIRTAAWTLRAVLVIFLWSR